MMMMIKSTLVLSEDKNRLSQLQLNDKVNANAHHKHVLYYLNLLIIIDISTLLLFPQIELMNFNLPSIIVRLSSDISFEFY